MNSVTAGNLSDEPQPQPPLRDQVGTGQGLCAVIFNLLVQMSKDNPAGDEAEAQASDENSPGLQYLLSELYEGWVQIVREMTESGETSVVRTFADSVAEVARELGSYIDAKKQFSVTSSKTEEYRLLTCRQLT